jgi:alkylhydroperoxidase family enzyme
VEISKLFFSPRCGVELNVHKTVAHHADLFSHWISLGRFLSAGGIVPERERELIILRVGSRAESVYEFGQHAVLGRQAKLSDSEIYAVTQNLELWNWTEDERAILAMVDDLFDNNCVSDGTWTALVRRWSPKELIELMMIAGYYRAVADFVNSLGVEREDGIPGWPSPPVRDHE